MQPPSTSRATKNAVAIFTLFTVFSGPNTGLCRVGQRSTGKYSLRRKQFLKSSLRGIVSEVQEGQGWVLRADNALTAVEVMFPKDRASLTWQAGLNRTEKQGLFWLRE